jgi:hypothetical protein
MGACKSCISKPESPVSVEETLIRNFEDQIPTYHLQHDEWVNHIKAAHTSGKYINEAQYAKACRAVNFNFDQFIESLGSESEELIQFVKVGNNFSFRGVLLLSIMLTSGDTTAKLKTFVSSFSQDEESLITKLEFERSLSVLIKLAISIIPKGANDRHEITSDRASKVDSVKNTEKANDLRELRIYIANLSTTLNPTLRTFCKMFYGSSNEVSATLLKSQLESSKEAHAMMDTRLTRDFAYKKYLAVAAFKKSQQKQDDTSEE